MSSNIKPQVGLGVNQLFVTVPKTIVSNRAPLGSDHADNGTFWLEPRDVTRTVVNGAWIATSTIAGVTTWLSLANAGVGTFTSLTVNPGPTSLSTVGSGAVTIGNAANIQPIIINSGTGSLFLNGNGHAIIIGNDANANTITVGDNLLANNIVLGGVGANEISIGTQQTAGYVQIGTNMTNGSISIGSATNAGAEIINVGPGGFALNGNGNTVLIADDNTANQVTLGSVTAGALTTIQGGNGTGLGVAAIFLGAAPAGDIQIGTVAQTGTIYLGPSTAGASVDIGTGAGATHITVGHATAGNITTLASPITALPGPVYIYTGAGAPANGLALHVGDLYINTTAATAVTRMYIATAAGVWTNFTCAA
jgi:hypothetical protein